METNVMQDRPERNHYSDGMKTLLNGRPCLQPLPLFLKPPRFPPLGDSLNRGFPGFGAQHFMGFERFHGGLEEGSRKRKRTPFKANPQELESTDEVTEEIGAKTVDRPHLSYHLPQHVPAPFPRYSPQMIDLNRFQLYRSLERFDGMQIKQEPVKPEGIWPPGPLLMHPSPSYFPKIHPGIIPFPFLIPSPTMHFSHGLYRRELLGRHRRSPNTNDSGLNAAEKLGVNIHIDDSYYVDVGENQKRWKCRMCEKSYTSKYNLVTHILGHSGIKPHGCSQCGKLFKQLSHLHTHMLTHQGTRPHKCQVCHKAFTQTSHLKRHMMQHSDVKPYSCGICGRGFAYPSELKAHEVKHERGQENICVDCGLDFPTLAQLKRHLTVHRGPTQYSCTECEKTFQYPSQLQNHMMKHKDIRPYICSECGMEFVQPHHLKQHTLTHKGVKEHKCGICGREFTLLANMKRHILIHTNIRAYQCHLCFKSFVQKQTLKAHMIVHSDVKPYKCKLCGKEFNRMHNLMGHMHLHSDSKPFKCLYCPSKFTLKGNLTRHMKVKHGIMDRGLESRGFRRRVRLRLSSQAGIMANFVQEEPFDLSQKTGVRLSVSQSDGESAQGSLCQEEEEEDSYYSMGQGSPEHYSHSNHSCLPPELSSKHKDPAEPFKPGDADGDEDKDKEEDSLNKEREKGEQNEKQKYYLENEEYPCIRFYESHTSASSGEFYSQSIGRN
ncbi:zinc finger protein 366 [Lepisosteus oculatus]|uniref:zinc finger protein 366 n=1 Tax=Lepisosteus oculatus TaxID=7918 RepID=UPI00371A7B16